jgi:hypothetical protein
MVTEPRPHNVHDHFVHYIYCRPEAVAIMLRRALPVDLCACLDLEALVLACPVYTDPFLRGRISDLGFSTRLIDGGASTPAHISIEHQSNPDALHPVRRVVYGSDFWTREARARPRLVPPFTIIIPVTFLQHPARHTPTQLSSVLGVPPALRDIVGTPFEARIYTTDFSGSVLDDPVAPWHFRVLVEAACAVLHGYHNEATLTEQRLAELATCFDVILEHFGPGDIQAFWTYITAVFENGEQLCAALMQLTHPSTREAYMTVQERWLAEGRKQGLDQGRRQGLDQGRKQGLDQGRRQGLDQGRRQGLDQGRKQGRTRGKAEAVLDVLALRKLPVPARVRRQVLATRDEPTLVGWLARALTVASAEELVATTKA